MSFYYAWASAGLLLGVFGGWAAWKIKTAEVCDAQALLDGTTATGAARPNPEARRDAIFAASFNPPHVGHLHVLRAIAKRHRQGTVYAVVGHNPSKRYVVSPEERASLLRACVAADPEALGNVRVEVVAGFIWQFAFACDVRKGLPPGAAHVGCVLYRGIRSWAKDGAAETWLHVLNLAGPLLLGPCKLPPETRYCLAPQANDDDPTNVLGTVSSSEVRAKVQAGERIAGLVPQAAEMAVTQFYRRAAVVDLAEPKKMR
jgi:cytidyltransferase-like protein